MSRARILLAPLGIAFGVAALVLALGGSLRAGDPSLPVTTAPSSTLGQAADPDVEAGRTLYLRDCGWCHGPQGEGSRLGPTLRGVGAASADFMLRTGRMPPQRIALSEEERVGTAEDLGVLEQPPRDEPIYTAGQIADLAEFVAGLGGGPEIPEVDPAAGDLATGADLYLRHCAACHGSTGIGAALTSGLVATDIRGLAAVEIAEAIRIGGTGLRNGNMPRFDEQVFDQRELDSVVAYVRYLSRPENRGGAGLGHLGPVAEGFVAVFVALPLLVLFLWWIGKRAGAT